MVPPELLGFISTLLMLCSRVNYFTTIFRGATRPHAFSWFVWGLISGIGFAAQVAEGAGAGSWARGFGAATCFLVVAIALFRGERDIKRGDWATFLIALAAIPLWVATRTPFWSVLLVCAIDTLGYYPTVRKSWTKPRQESAISYTLSCLAAGCSLLAIEHYTPSTWLYPVVLTLSNGGMAVFLWARRGAIDYGSA